MTDADRVQVQVLHYSPRPRHYRALLTDGRLVDVFAERDTSDMRGWLLAQVWGRTKPKDDDPIIAGMIELDRPEAVKDVAP